jgi:hypothetical protein
MKWSRFAVITTLLGVGWMIGEQQFPRLFHPKLYRQFQQQEIQAGDCWHRDSCYDIDANFVLARRWENFQARVERNEKAQNTRLNEIKSIAVFHMGSSEKPITEVLFLDADGYNIAALTVDGIRDESSLPVRYLSGGYDVDDPAAKPPDW